MQYFSLASTLICALLWGAPALCDRGLIFVAPVDDKAKLLPSTVKFFEPNQTALIAFDGEEEIIFLTTNVSASHSVKVLEVLPLPSRPKVLIGEMDTLNSAVWVLNSKIKPLASEQVPENSKALVPVNKRKPVAIFVDRRQLGAHDVSVVQVLSKESFSQWVEQNMKKLGASLPAMPEWMKPKIASYTARGFNWFAFDVVNLLPAQQSISPLRYRFKTKRLFYPLTITKVSGPSAVRLIVMSSQPIKCIEPIKGATLNKVTESYPLHKEEMMQIDPEIHRMLDKIPSFERPHIQMWEINNSDGKDYASDLFARF